MTDWSNRTLAPKPKLQPRLDTSAFSPPLARALGYALSSIVGFSALHFGGRLLGLGSDYWTSSDTWSLKAVSLIVGAFLLAALSSVIGWAVAAKVKVKTETTNFKISVLWHYLANGTLIWFSLFGLVLTKYYGKEGLKQLVKAHGTWQLGIYPLIVTGVICVCIAVALLWTGLVRQDRKPAIPLCVLVSAPFGLGLSYHLYQLFGVALRSWIFLGFLHSFVLIIVSAYMIQRDQFQREQIKKF